MGRSADPLGESADASPPDAQTIENEVLRTQLELAAARSAQLAEQLAAHQRALAEIRSSRVWRLGLKYYRVVERFAPAGTRRRSLYQRAGRGVARPVRWWLDRRAGVERLPEIVLPTSQTPVVSVVIPVHGKWTVTEQCLRSFVINSPTTPFEIIVVDDASPDDTVIRLGRVRGVRVVALERNVGFVGAVNAGVAAARGDFVVLLNNDTEIWPGWLEALVETGSEPGVGLVGSKLVYPDGRLQEAGGIIFRNGGGWNFGRFDDPNRPMYNFRRDVDYCSGAAILVRRDLLAQIGGLDEYFAPAYYDDVDLAFSVRAAGLRVVYEPRAVVTHHEGVSHGTDEAKGIKRFQEINRKKLLHKWADELAEQCPQVEALVPAAARRRAGHGLILVIDHHVPQPDQDAGSVRMLELLRTLRRLGHGVLFIPDNRDPGGAWGEVLRSEGIEVLSGAEPLELLMEDLRGLVVGVIAARVGMAWPYLLLTRRLLPGVPFVFDTIDLHHVREQRRAEVTKIPSEFERARATRELELALVRASDATLVVSSAERELLADEVPEAVVSVVPTFHQAVDGPPAESPEGRRGALFVGSYAHPPNADAIRWFLTEILPFVLEQEPDFVVRVVGKDAPQDIRAMAGDHVELLGWVPDLAPLYASTRVAIAPLRFGAGLKGKVGEAMSHGVPVVGTAVAFEGLEIVHGVGGWCADSPREFADGVIELSRDDALWGKMSTVGLEHIEGMLGTAAFERSVVAALGAVDLGPGVPRADGCSLLPAVAAEAKGAAS